MARPRKPTATLRSIAECEEAMFALRRAAIERARLETARNKKIADITEYYAGDIAAQTSLQADLELQLQTYYMAHLEELEKDGKRSVQLAHGVMGRRLGSPAVKFLNKSWTLDSVIAKVREKWGGRFIRLAEPELDKAAIKKANLPAEELKAAGLRIEQGEEFYAEPERAPTSEAA